MNKISDNKIAQSSKLLILGMIGCLFYMIGDELWMYVGQGKQIEEIGLLLDSRWISMPYWRFAASILLGAVGTPLFYLGFREMHGMIAQCAKTKTERRMAKVFRIGYLAGTMYWTYVHAICLILSVVLKSVYETGGDLDAAAAVTQKVLLCNAAPMIAAFVLGDGCLTVAAVTLVWKKTLPVGKWALLCNPLFFPLLLGNLSTLLPWPINQFDHLSESLGNLAVLAVGLSVLRGRTQNKKGKVMQKRRIESNGNL